MEQRPPPPPSRHGEFLIFSISLSILVVPWIELGYVWSQGYYLHVISNNQAYRTNERYSAIVSECRIKATAIESNINVAFLVKEMVDFILDSTMHPQRISKSSRYCHNYRPPVGPLSSGIGAKPQSSMESSAILRSSNGKLISSQEASITLRRCHVPLVDVVADRSLCAHNRE